jgi:hypothetical protein
MQNLTISFDDEQIEFLKTLDNYSKYVRDSVELKRGKSEISLQEQEIIVKDIEKQYQLECSKLDELIDKVLKQKDQLTVSEQERIDQLKAAKDKKLKDFMDKWSPIFETYDEIKNFEFKEGWKLTSNLAPLFERICKDGHRIGMYNLTLYLEGKLKVLQKVQPTLE